MGLHTAKFRFEGTTPNLGLVKDEARRRLGDNDGIESLIADGQTVVAYCMLDPFTHPVVCAILEEAGGQAIGLDGLPSTATVPEWAHRPIREMRWQDRLAVRYRWWTRRSRKKQP